MVRRRLRTTFRQLAILPTKAADVDADRPGWRPCSTCSSRPTTCSNASSSSPYSARGAFLTLRLGFVQLRRFGHGLAVVAGRHDDPGAAGDVTHFQALTTALSATVGIGNIAGVAIAIHWGGPGAVFWMWVTAFLGMATKFAEVTLAQRYRVRDAAGAVSGGPMHYIEQGLGAALATARALLRGGPRDDGARGAGTPSRPTPSPTSPQRPSGRRRGRSGLISSAVVRRGHRRGHRADRARDERARAGDGGPVRARGPGGGGPARRDDRPQPAGHRDGGVPAYGRGRRHGGGGVPADDAVGRAARSVQQRGRAGFGPHRPLGRQDRRPRQGGGGGAARAGDRHPGHLHDHRARDPVHGGCGARRRRRSSTWPAASWPT